MHDDFLIFYEHIIKDMGIVGIICYNFVTGKEHTFQNVEKGEVGVLKIVINGIPPSINKWRTMNHYEEANQKRDWENIVIQETWAQLKRHQRKTFQNKTLCTYTYFFPNTHRHDPSNYSPKWIEDGLVKAGILIDDSFDHVDLRIRKGGVDRVNPRVEITIEEIDLMAN